MFNRNGEKYSKLGARILLTTIIRLFIYLSDIISLAFVKHYIFKAGNPIYKELN